MINKFKTWILSNFLNSYSKLKPRKRKFVNQFFFIYKKNLRSYYTIPIKSKNSVPMGTSSLLNLPNKKFIFFENHHLDHSVRDSIPSVAGYVPYLKNQTKIYFYHFFSVNYGIRKTFRGQISLIGKNNETVKSVVLSFPTRFNGEIDLKKIFKNFDGESCIFELYHDRIPVNHAGHQGHLRFWGIYGNESSTVHSMPLFPFYVKNDSPKYSDRRFYPKILHDKKTNNCYFINCNLKIKTFHYNLEGDMSNKLKLLNGFTIQMIKKLPGEEFDSPSGVWHHSEYRRNKFEISTNQDYSQIAAIPNIDKIDLIIFLGEFIDSNEEVIFSIYSSKIRKVISTKKVLVNTEKQIRASEIFKLDILKGNNLIIEPSIESKKHLFKNGYVNTQYIIDDNLCDGVHAHPYTPSKSSQGLKFMHYKIDKNTSSIISIWGAKEDEIFFRLRVFDSKSNFEKCFYLSVESNQLTNEINLSDLNIPNGSGIVQLESDTSNPGATSFIMTKSRNKTFLSTCHMTGG